MSQPTPVVPKPTTDIPFVKLSDTNLSGVSAVNALEPDVAAGLTHSEAVVRELLGPLRHLDTSVAPIRDRLLNVQWPIGARITPQLTPQPGVTHLLAAPTKTSDAAVTSNNWAGSTIAGTWAHAVGLWHVPTVSIPSTAPGTDGGWDSSSWVGIDGTYGSNDVLQAGVQQSVKSDGSTTYVAWYEWFAPKVSGSPPYIYQTNIDNLTIEPGDEVFAGIHYQGGQGYVMFGNVGRGQYFTIQITPPPGATFSGNSVEWIVEAFNAGEPSTSLPRFSPVQFTAMGSDANGTTGAHPSAGDSSNIVAFGRPLTTVVTTTDSVNVNYLDQGFFPLPGQAVFDVQHQQIAAVSRGPNNLDLFVIGNDGHPYSAFWTPSGWNGWFALPGQAVFDPQHQQIAAVSRDSNHLDLFVIGNDGGHVWTTFWTPSGWNKDWFPLPGQAVFDVQHQHVAAVSRNPNQIDLFVIGNDGHPYSTFWNPSGNPSGWREWFSLPGQAVFDVQHQQIAAVSRGPNNLDLFVIGNDGGHVWTTFWNANGWNKDWFALPGQAVFDVQHQQIAAVSRGPNNLDLFVVGNDGHPYKTFWNDHSGWN
jgi:Peptidase A4 family